MAATMRPLLALVAFLSLTLRVLADCSSYGVDYANGGAYYIDGASNQYFSFITVFQGCSAESINPVLVDPEGNQYVCSAINTTPAGAQVTSTCGIPFSAMRSGGWKIVVAGDQIAVQRSITLTVGVPQTTTVTATPTIVLGITTTPRARTVTATVPQTQTLILVPSTVTANCNGATQTVTDYGGGNGRTQTITSTIVRTSTEGGRTSSYVTTITTAASCHYSNKRRDVEIRDDQGMQSVNAVTITYTQTTYTVTQTRVSTAPAATTTENVYRIVTQTVTPAPQTACRNGGQGVTVTVGRGGNGVVTQTNIVYSTTRVSGTVWLVQTTTSTISNAASATACWRAGGWFGR